MESDWWGEAGNHYIPYQPSLTPSPSSLSSSSSFSMISEEVKQSVTRPYSCWWPQLLQWPVLPNYFHYAVPLSVQPSSHHRHHRSFKVFHRIQYLYTHNLFLCQYRLSSRDHSQGHIHCQTQVIIILSAATTSTFKITCVFITSKNSTSATPITNYTSSVPINIIMSGIEIKLIFINASVIGINSYQLHYHKYYKPFNPFNQL